MWTLLFLLAGLALFGLLTWLLSVVWRRLVDKTITVHFRAAESITEHNQLPDEWVVEVNRKLSSKTATIFGLRKLSGINLLLRKIDETANFFAGGSFYADDNAKTLLLNQLTEVRKKVEEMSWEEVMLERNQIRNLPRP